jgi:hypothetical protein
LCESGCERNRYGHALCSAGRPAHRLRDPAAEVEDRLEELKRLLRADQADFQGVLMHAFGILARFDIELGTRCEVGRQMSPKRMRPNYGG